MDPDEVELEPAGVHNHDRLTHNPQAPGGGGNGSWACRLLRCGCDFARKAALAGAAATAAPVVVPPLIVLSAAGVALSVPFAAYLASLAATDYLTRALLRACRPPSRPYHYHRQEFDDGVEQEFGRGPPAFGHLGTEAEQRQREEDEFDTALLLLLPRDHGVSEALAPAFADDGVDEEEGKTSAQESGRDSCTASRGQGTEEHTPMERKEVLPMGFGVSASANPLFSDDYSQPQVQEMGQGEFSVPDPVQQPFRSENWSEKEGDVYSKYYKEEDGRSTEENKATKEKLSQGFGFPESSGDKDNEDQEKGEGEFSAQNSGQYSLLLNPGNENEQSMAVEEKKSAEDMPLRGFVASESPAPLFHDEEKETDTSLLLPRDHDASEAPVPAFSDEVGGEFSSVQESGLKSYTSDRGEEAEEHTPMRGSESTGKEVLPHSIGVSASAKPLFLDEDNLVQEKREGGFSVHNSGQQSYQSENRNKEEEEDGKSTEENKSIKETLSQGFNFPEPPVPSPRGDDNNVVQEKGGVFFVQNSGQKSFQSKNWNEKEDGGKTREENKSNEETLSQGFYFPEQPVPTPGGDDDNVVQEKGEGELSVQSSGQQSFQSKNWNDKEEDDGRTTEENKSTEETVSQGLYFPESHVPASGDKGNVVRQKGEGEFSAQNLAPYSLPLNTKDEKEKDITMEEKKPTEDMPPRDFTVSESSVSVLHGEDDVVQSKEGFEVTVQGVVEEADSNTDLDMGEVDNVQVEIIAIAAPESEALPSCRMDLVTGEIVDVYAGIAAAVEPETESEVLHPSNLTTSESSADPETREIVDVQVDIVDAAVPLSEVLPLSSLAALESQAIAETAHVGEVQNEKSMAIEEKNSIEDMPPRGSFVSESSVPMLGGEDDVAQSKEGFEVAVQELMEEANSNTDLVKGEVVDVQVEIIGIAAPESEVLSPGNFAAHDSPADPVAGEIVRVQVDIAAAAATGSEMLHPSDLATSDTPADSVTGEIVNVQVDAAAAAAHGSEVLPLSSLAACESQAVAETEHVGEIIGITVVEDIVRDFDDVNKGVSFIPVASVHDGEDVMSSGSTPYLSTVEEEMSDQPNQSTGAGYAVKNEAFGSRVAAGGEAGYTEEELREQLDALRTITGYGAVPSPTLEGELAGLYIFVGVEPSVGSSDTLDHLMELNAKLRFLKSIIGID
ncbi:uncharacterized protein LOC124646874 [Lolium rigidum]|uniref:uncharacterized protein LOC124646874 n=1 Tax=Lolium rigidum TaxID=89674 RepID=UPI001F5CD75B|nr:uncharacterized protein LOC124646874 [Lolium rigidum]